jgi:hypothetical protein
MGFVHTRLHPGPVVFLDLWTAVNMINHFRHAHMTVNHKYNFVDPRTHATTNHVESVCKKSNKSIKNVTVHTENSCKFFVRIKVAAKI